MGGSYFHPDHWKRELLLTFLLQGKQLITIPEAYSGLSDLHRCARRHGLTPFPFGVGPAAAACHLLDLVVPGIAIGCKKVCKATLRLLRCISMFDSRQKKFICRIQSLTIRNICSVINLGESQNSQLSGEVHTPVGPQTFMDLVGHYDHPVRRKIS